MALKPRIAESPQVRLIDLKSKPFFIVASVEVGNTTTKSILTATNLDTGRTHIINKVVRMTRDVRPPKPGEVVLLSPACASFDMYSSYAERGKDFSRSVSKLKVRKI